MFAINAMYKSDRVVQLGNAPSAGGAGQEIARSPAYRIAVWSHYAGPVTRFFRFGTLDNPDLMLPDTHIYARSKQPWINIPPHVPFFAEYYEREAVCLRRRLHVGMHFSSK